MKCKRPVRFAAQPSGIAKPYSVSEKTGRRKKDLQGSEKPCRSPGGEKTCKVCSAAKWDSKTLQRLRKNQSEIEKDLQGSGKPCKFPGGEKTCKVCSAAKWDSKTLQRLRKKQG